MNQFDTSHASISSHGRTTALSSPSTQYLEFCWSIDKHTSFKHRRPFPIPYSAQGEKTAMVDEAMTPSCRRRRRGPNLVTGPAVSSFYACSRLPHRRLRFIAPPDLPATGDDKNTIMSDTNNKFKNDKLKNHRCAISNHHRRARARPVPLP